MLPDDNEDDVVVGGGGGGTIGSKGSSVTKDKVDGKGMTVGSGSSFSPRSVAAEISQLEFVGLSFVVFIVVSSRGLLLVAI